MPACPYFANFHGDGKVLPSGRGLPSSLLVFSGRTGRRFPSHLASPGLGSNVSIWAGPPDMNRKMILLVRGLKWGAWAAPPASPASTPASATEPNPPANRPSISRRVIRVWCLVFGVWCVMFGGGWGLGVSSFGAGHSAGGIVVLSERRSLPIDFR